MDVTVNADSNCTATVTPQTVNGGSTVDPSCGPFTLHLDPPGPYAMGDTQVTLSIMDRCGQTDSCPAMLTVVDSTDPMIDCPAVDPAHSADAGQCSFTVPGPASIQRSATTARTRHRLTTTPRRYRPIHWPAQYSQ